MGPFGGIWKQCGAAAQHTALYDISMVGVSCCSCHFPGSTHAVLSARVLTSQQYFALQGGTETLCGPSRSSCHNQRWRPKLSAGRQLPVQTQAPAHSADCCPPAVAEPSPNQPSPRLSLPLRKRSPRRRWAFLGSGAWDTRMHATALVWASSVLLGAFG